MTTPETTGGEQAGGRFLPGKSGNPSGRPKGALNKTTEAALVLLEGEAEALTRKCVDLAMTGDMAAMRICMDRIIPTKRALTAELTTVESPFKRVADAIEKGIEKADREAAANGSLRGPIGASSWPKE
jgi:hypothetical protein